MYAACDNQASNRHPSPQVHLDECHTAAQCELSHCCCCACHFLQDPYHLYFLFDLMPGGDLMDVLVAEAKIIKHPVPQKGSLRQGCLSPKVGWCRGAGPAGLGCTGSVYSLGKGVL